MGRMLPVTSITFRERLLSGILESDDCGRGIPFAKQAPNCHEDAEMDAN
jgi:hypothetical protein